VKPAVGTTKVAIEDLKPGDGAALGEGDNAVLHLVAYRGDTGKSINSTWESGQRQTIPIDVAQTLPGLVEGLVGMKIGGRRQIIIPFADAFGDAGNEGLGLPAKTDLVLIVDLLATA
jgi:peptidylprolyl isomerase